MQIALQLFFGVVSLSYGLGAIALLFFLGVQRAHGEISGAFWRSQWRRGRIHFPIRGER